MKLSMWSTFYYFSPEEAMAEFVKHGYYACELSDEHGQALIDRGDAKTEGRKFKEYCDSIGMQVLQGHLNLRTKLCREGDTDILINWLDLFEACGVKNAVLHLDNLNERDLTNDEKRAENLKALRKLVEHIKGKDIKIALENMEAFPSTIDDLLWFIDELGDENLSICLDTGHLNISENPDPRDFILRAGKHLHALHVHDNNGKADRHLFPFNTFGALAVERSGNVNWKAFAEALKEIGYNDLFNYEVPAERICPKEILDMRLEYAKGVFEYILSL